MILLGVPLASKMRVAASWIMFRREALPPPPRYRPSLSRDGRRTAQIYSLNQLVEWFLGALSQHLIGELR